MRRTSRGLGLVGVAIVVCFGLTRTSLALVFSSSCDRFEIDGNAFGPQDGTLDFTDDFDSGSLAPNWSVLLGSAEEAGTNVTMHNPGVGVQLGPTLLEISTIENQVHDIGNGEGSFTGSSYWSSGLPDTNSEFHFQLYSLSPIIEAAGITVNNLSPQVATQQGNGALAGYSATASVTHGVGSGFETIESHSVPIVPAAVTGEIVLRLALDDATDMLTCSFSLDGGTTFSSPFPAMHVFNMGVTSYEILLGVAGLTQNSAPPSQQTLPLQVLSVKNPPDPTKRKVTYKAKTVRNAPTFLLGNPTTGGAKVNIKLDTGSQCFNMPAAGWTRLSRRFRYRDPNGTYGPVTGADLRQVGIAQLQNKVVIAGRNGPITVVPPNPGVQGDVDFVVAGTYAYCASTAGGAISKNDAHQFTAKNAPAPAACYAAACSPSGAFLDTSGTF